MRVDCHVHVVGDPSRYRQIPGRTYLASPAPLEDLLAAAAPSGIDTFVVVQPSFYGNDNTLVLETLDRLGGRGRGVVALDPGTTTRGELEAQRARGVRGVRVNRYSALARGGPPLATTVTETAALAGAAGLHVEVMATLEVLSAAIEALAGASATIVLDHYGLPGDTSPADKAAAALLELLGLGHVYLKCSAPYRSGRDPLETRPAREWLEALLGVAPDRCVFGSDWPHTPPSEDHRGPDVPAPYRAIPYARTVSDLEAAIGDGAVLEAVLGANAAALYGFGD